MTRSSIPNAGFTRSRNFQDRTGYPQVAWDEANPFLAGLIGGGIIFGLSLWAMPADGRLPSAPSLSQQAAEPVSRLGPVGLQSTIAERAR